MGNRADRRGLEDKMSHLRQASYAYSGRIAETGKTCFERGGNMKYLSPPDMLNKRKESKIGVYLFAVLCVIAFCILWSELWFVQNFIVVLVDGRSMENTVMDGDILYADKNKSAKHGDIIIIDMSNCSAIESDCIIKRLIATEGDTVRCVGGVVSVKYAGDSVFTDLVEPYANGVTSDFGETYVDSGEIYFLGDNRTVSYDSRMLGCSLYSEIIGVVPQWSVSAKGMITGWETFRSALIGTDQNHAHDE